MAICETCNLEMNTAIGCTDPIYEYKDGMNLERIPYGPGEETRCYDCGAYPGKLHHPGCDMEQCPRCLGQIQSCKCPAWEDEE